VAAQDLRLMNPAALAETHPNCRKNDAGEPLLPNGTPWRQQLLMLGLSSKLLVDAEKALDIRKVPEHRSMLVVDEMCCCWCTCAESAFDVRNWFGACRCPSVATRESFRAFLPCLCLLRHKHQMPVVATGHAHTLPWSHMQGNTATCSHLILCALCHRRPHLAMFRPQKLPPIPYLLSNMIQPRKPRKFPEDEREIKTDKELAKLPMEERKEGVR
jgi:hypothetical protein